MNLLCSSNKLFVIITQIGKVGSLVEVKTQELQKGRFTDIVHDTRLCTSYFNALSE